MSALTKPFKLHGGKHYQAPAIVELMPSHLHYVEPYFGGGSVLLAKPYDGISEVINDIHKELTTFWRVLQDKTLFAEMQRVLSVMPFSQVEFDDAASPATNDLDTAIRFFVRCRLSRSGQLKAFTTLTRRRVRRAMNAEASARLSAIEGLPDVHERLKRVVILNDDALTVIKQQDGPNTLFYLDPPYLHETRVATSVYAHEMTASQHAQLLDTLATNQGKFLLSGYPSELYDLRATKEGWRHFDILSDNKASSAPTKSLKTERIWMNY
jgi:DNA adenine methylase